MSDELQTPEEWATLDHIRIWDPDGWRTPYAKDFKEPLTREDYTWRMMISTVQRLPDDTP